MSIFLDDLSNEELLNIINNEHQILLQNLNKQSVAALELFSRINKLNLFERVEIILLEPNISLIQKKDLIDLAEIYLKL